MWGKGRCEGSGGVVGKNTGMGRAKGLKMAHTFLCVG